MSPQRIQRQRTKGWRMPENAVYVGRPTKWGNPYVLGAVIDWSRFYATISAPETVYSAGYAVGLYRDWLNRHPVPRTGFGPTSPADAVLADLAELRGKDLACWCPLDQPCHADVLLDFANREVAP